MKLLTELITIDRSADQPVYLQITNAFIQNIRRGRLRKGLKLPGSRRVADLLNVNRMTVVTAFDELQSQGWIETIPRKGTFVNHSLPDITPQKIHQGKSLESYPSQTSFYINENKLVSFPISKVRNSDKLILNDGFPDVRLAPVDELMTTMKRLTKQPVFRKYLRYGSAKGTDLFRSTLSDYLRDTRGIPVSPDNILVTRGAQMGINLAAKLLIEPGDHIIVGEPSYFGASITFKQSGGILNRVAVDEEGMDVDQVEQLCKTEKIRLLYVIPHHHHPTTVTMPPERRLKLLKLAEEYKFAIIEDDYDYDFHYASSPLMSMASLDQHGSVIYIGTLTKTFAPAVRVGFMVAPENFIDAAAGLRRTMDWQGDQLMEVALSELYKNGTIARYIKKSVTIYRERRDHFCNLLETKLNGAVEFKKPSGGMSVWTTFTGANLKRVSRTAYKKGLMLSDGTEYNTDAKKYNAARLGFASLTFEEQEKAIKILANSIK